MRFVDIDNSYCWYRQSELWISTMRFVDIDNSYCWCQQFKLLISIIGIKIPLAILVRFWLWRGAKFAVSHRNKNWISLTRCRACKWFYYTQSVQCSDKYIVYCLYPIYMYIYIIDNVLMSFCYYLFIIWCYYFKSDFDFKPKFEYTAIWDKFE